MFPLSEFFTDPKTKFAFSKFWSEFVEMFDVFQGNKIMFLFFSCFPKMYGISKFCLHFYKFLRITKLFHVYKKC